jgi:ABC-type multidrug transport system permease subunit
MKIDRFRLALAFIASVVAFLVSCFIAGSMNPLEWGEEYGALARAFASGAILLSFFAAYGLSE